MKSFYPFICAVLVGLVCLVESRIERPHWSFGNFPGTNLKGPFNRPPMKPFPHHGNSFSGSRFSPPSHGFQDISPERQAYLLGLAAHLLRHKQAQSEHSSRLLNSFGSRVAPFSKKKK